MVNGLAISLLILTISQYFVLANVAYIQSADPLVSVISLEDMSAFKNPPKEWKIVGEIYYDLINRNSSQEENGKGVLIKKSFGNNNDDLFTEFEHGDMDLEFDFMLPMGSKTAVYLQSRYGIRLNDSWSDDSSIAEASGAIFMPKNANVEFFRNVPPRMDICKAPGLWQNLKIYFEAPKFNNIGKKISHAKFKKVIYNGVVIHENIEVPGVTRQGLSEKENPLGPLMFSGNGEMALRNIKYKIYKNEKVEIIDLRYSYYEGKFEKIPDFSTISPTKSNTTEKVTWKVAENNTGFALKFDGALLIPVSGTYNFQIQSPGIIKLVVANKKLIDLDGIFKRKKSDQESAYIDLEKGKYTFTITYVKDIPFGSPQLGLFVEGPGISRHALHAPSSIDIGPMESPIYIHPDNAAVVQRCFIEYNQEKQTLCVAVGEPGEIHYAMDLSQGAIMGIWKGKFLDATTMWTGRGEEQVAKPLGSFIEFLPKPTIAFLKNKNERWPESIQEKDHFRFKGYQLDEAGRPTFRYNFNNAVIEDKIIPESNKFFSRTIKIQNENNLKSLWLHMAEGNKIDKIKDGLYAVNDKSFYIQFFQSGGQKPLIRKTQLGEELIIPITEKQDQLKYTIIW